MKLLILLSVVLCLLTSCQHIYYAPNTSNAPLFSEKGETRVNGLYSTGGDSEYDGAEFQFAHAVSKNAAVIANAFTASKQKWSMNTQVGILIMKPVRDPILNLEADFLVFWMPGKNG